MIASWVNTAILHSLWRSIQAKEWTEEIIALTHEIVMPSFIIIFEMGSANSDPQVYPFMGESIMNFQE